MNTNDTDRNVLTLEDIIRLKAQKLEEIRASRKRISQTARSLFHRDKAESGTNLLLANFTSGIALFNGIMTGFRIIRRIRNIFRTKK